MALHYRTQGIILKKQDVGEADRVFTVFTRDFGKVKLWAISERKITSKLRGGLELFYRSDIEFIQGKTRKTITDALALWRYPVIRGDMERLRIAQRFADLADQLISGQERDENMWNLFRETLSFLDRPALESRNLTIFAYYFFWNVVSLAGYTPPLAQIEAQDARIAEFIVTLLERKGKALQTIDTKGMNEVLLRELSQEYLLKIVQN